MEIGGSAVHFSKRIVKLEEQCNQLKAEKFMLKDLLMAAKGKEEKLVEKCAKVKDKCVKVKEEFGSEKSKWMEEEENLRDMCRQVGVDKKKLEIDLEAARRRITNCSVELAKKLMDKDNHFKSLLEENNSRLHTTFEARLTKVKEEFDSKGRKWREEEEKIREECRQLNVEKRKLEIDLKAAKRGIEEGGDGLAKKLKASEAEAEGLKSLLEEKEGSVITLSAKNELVEMQNRSFEMDLHTKMAMEAKKQIVEEKNLELIEKIKVLEGEKGQMEAEYGKLKKKIFNVNKALEIEKKRGQTPKRRVIELVKRIGVLERVREAEKMSMEEEAQKKVSELTHTIEVLERERREIEANLRLENREKSEEIKRILDEKAAVEAEKTTMEAETKEKVCEFVRRIEVLMEAEVCVVKKKKSEEIERIQNKMMTLEAEKRTREDEGTRRIELLEREKNEMEAKVYQAEKKKNEEIQRILNEKRAVKENYEKKILEIVDRNDILERVKRGFEAEIAERDELMNVLAQQNSCLEDKKEELEMEINSLASKRKVEEEKILELTRKIEVLEGEKGQMEAEYCKLKKESRSVTGRIFSANKALEAEKKRGKAARERITDLVKRIGVLERVKEAEKMAMEEEGKQKVLELTHRIEVLEREKKEIDADVCQAKKEKNEELERIQNAMIALEAEKRTREDEGTRRIELLKREKNELEAKVCQAKQEKGEEIQRIAIERMAVKEDYEKKIVELVDRNDILEREKRGFEAEITERDEVMKVLAQENSRFKDRKKELEMEINRLALKSMEDVQLSQHAHLTNNVVMLGTPWPREGQNSTSRYEDELTRTNACKRKRFIGKWEEPGHTDGSNGVDVQVVTGKIPCEWEVDQDVLNAFEVYPELCLKAVCALYRQHQRLGVSTNTSLSSEYEIPPHTMFHTFFLILNSNCSSIHTGTYHLCRRIALAEYLISEDPEGRKTKKMMGKLDKFDRDAVGKCMTIAKQHYKQVFEIYKNKEDLVFLP